VGGKRRRGDGGIRTYPWIKQQIRTLVQSVTDYAIFMLDPQGRVASWNPGAHRFKGYEPEEIIGEHFSRMRKLPVT